MLKHHIKERMKSFAETTFQKSVVIHELGEGIKTVMNLSSVFANHFHLNDEVPPPFFKGKEKVSGGQPHPSGVGIPHPENRQNDGGGFQGMGYKEASKVNDGMEIVLTPVNILDVQMH